MLSFLCVLSIPLLWAQPTPATLQLDMLADLAKSLSPTAAVINAPFDDEPFQVDDAYYNGTFLYNAAYLSRPRAVIRCVTAADVAHAVVFLNSHALSFRVHSSGHNLAGYSGASCAQYLIDLSGLRDLARGANGTTVFGPGIMSWELFRFLVPYREVVVSCDPHLHALGMILVGGLSELTPIQGITADLVLELEVVLANGSIVTASAEKNSDLFFALRGAGSNSFGIVTSATIRAIKVPKDMGKGSIVLGAKSDAGVEAFMRGYRDDFVLSDKSGVSTDMGVYLTLSSSPLGRGFVVEWTYFGNDIVQAKKGLNSWVRKLAVASNLTVKASKQASATYEEYIAGYEGKHQNSGTPEEWISPFASSVSDDLLRSFTNLTNWAVAEGANSAVILILAQQTNGRPAGLALKGSDRTSSFPHRSATFWFLDISSCPFSNLGDMNPCRRFVSSLYSASKRDPGYLGLYHGIQNRFLETQPNFLDDYFAKSANPARWSKLMNAKRKWDPENRFCAPQSVVPCVSPSADACLARGSRPKIPVSASNPGQTCSAITGCVSGFSCRCFPVPNAKSKAKAKLPKANCFCVSG